MSTTSVGSGASARFTAIREVSTRVPRRFDPPRDEKGRRMKVSEFFGRNTFGVHQMAEKLPKDVYRKLISTVEHGKKLDPDIADTVAHAIKEWALERGVTHFCHWFQPQTGLTAEKHDAFLCFDDSHRAMEKFTGAQLIQSEPDASSFPSGGMRTTFEARGYTAWDPSSPVFIMDGASTKTLCIPSVFISYTGHALDEKTGLIRSIEAVSTHACELLELIGHKNVSRIVPTLGAEQEFFLVDRAFYSLRPDLIMTGRSLVGGQPPKGQELEDHYFGSIPSRVQAFMTEMEYELFKLGVPIKTRHNEVAPGQFEVAPIFEESNISTDHNQLLMEVLRKVAARHQFAVLLHEKPFAGVNGSGKHNNWSLMAAGNGHAFEGENLLDPGKTPHENLRFLLVLAGILKGVHRHAGLMRAAISSAGNDHRLGANEAPPAIISVFLGNMLDGILNQIEKGNFARSQNIEAEVLKLGVSKLPEVARDNTDRNRTSPFAFTGNKFEFRAVGSASSTAFPVTILNSAVAEAFSEITAVLKEFIASGKPLEAAIMETIQAAVKETRPIRFEGNNYSDEWIKEAEKRGIPNLKTTPEALKQMMVPSSEKLLTSLGVYSREELESHYHVRLERYIKDMTIEIETLLNMIDTLVLPAAFAYHSMLAEGVVRAKTAGVSAPQSTVLKRMTELTENLQEKTATLSALEDKILAMENDETKAMMMAMDIGTAMSAVREICDELEGIVADDFWPLPKYREMLFLK